MERIRSAELVEGVPTDKFIASFVKRAALLRRCGVEAVYVFDGGRMPGKAAEEADRQRARARQRATAWAHKRAGNSNAANEAYQRAVDVTPEMAKAVIDRLRAEGHACVVAPYEADVQMAYLIRHGFVDGVITEDSDMIPHQCKSVFFKWTPTASAKRSDTMISRSTATCPSWGSHLTSFSKCAL